MSPTLGSARSRLNAIPAFCGMTVEAVEAYTLSNRHSLVTQGLMAEIRQKMGTSFQPKELRSE